jgi:hypothetical protein
MMHSVPNDSAYEPLNEKDEPVFLNTLCPSPGCTFPDTHHHLEECAGEPTGCDGKTDEYDQTKICCQLGDLYDPAWPAPDPEPPYVCRMGTAQDPDYYTRPLPMMTREEARELLKRPAPNTLAIPHCNPGIY